MGSTSEATTTAAPRATSSVPRRPRLLPGIPVLRRKDREIQIGTDPRHAVVLGGLSEPLLREISRLDGSLTREELLEQTAQDERESLLSVLCELARARLLEDAAAVPAHSRGAAPPVPRPDPAAGRFTADATTWALRTGRPSAAMRTTRSRTVAVVHGDGRIAVALGYLLAAAGVGWVRVCARGTVRTGDLGSGYLAEDLGQPRARAAARALRRAAGTVRTAPLCAGTAPDIVLLADCPVPEPSLVASLRRAGTPHLVTYAREGGGIVGPLVVPHVTSCLRCLNLHRADRDSSWPAVATQLAGAPQPTGLPCAMTLASYAAGQALRLIDGERPGTDTCRDGMLYDGSVELNPFDGELRRRKWEPHSACDCGAARRHDR